MSERLNRFHINGFRAQRGFLLAHHLLAFSQSRANYKAFEASSK
ncbi:hypothetical protein ARMA_1620 [Ardenticatena maritima]|uniref:Uncharacterized protein n=1 Tax=Ardenticatena maritima TaxID=872965 RepID=A0A0M9UCS9_9CHLR|nr:hypothetical protein ARMA_1620 [Ardenticatena maritima]